MKGAPKIRTLLALVAVHAAFHGCSAEPSRAKWHLVEKGPFQALYRPDGHLDRVAYDGNGDHRAEVVTFFAPGGAPLRAQIDTDNDGIVDRWEFYGPDGRVAKVGTSRRIPGKPDLWSYPDGFGGVARREYDDDGDGKPDRAEVLLGDQVVAEEFATKGDGHWNRRIIRAKDGSIARIDLDSKGDGSWQTSLPARR